MNTQIFTLAFLTVTEPIPLSVLLSAVSLHIYMDPNGKKTNSSQNDAKNRCIPVKSRDTAIFYFATVKNRIISVFSAKSGSEIIYEVTLHW